MKINGWKRIGIIASVVWVLCAGVYTYNSEIDSASDVIAQIHVSCDADLTGLHGDVWERSFDECNKVANDSLAIAVSNARLEAASVAFIPVPLGWAFAYLLLFLVRWVRRGFIRSS